MHTNSQRRAASAPPVINRTAQLSDTGCIADDLYLLAHHECTGRPHLQPRAVMPVQHVLLGRLATACGLGHQMSLYLPPAARLHLEEAAGYLDTGLRTLVAATQAAVDGALLSHRM